MTIESEPTQPTMLEASGHRCPFCKSTMIEGGSVEIQSGEATQKVGCNECSAEWIDGYKISQVSILTMPQRYDSEVQGRAPTREEREAITNCFEGYQPGIIHVHDNYISDGPGYTGWLAVTVGGEPQLCATFIKNDMNRIEISTQAASIDDPERYSPALKEPLPTLLRMTVKECGSYDPDEVMPRIEEQLTGDQYEIVDKFLTWVRDNNLGFGRNIQEVYSAYLRDDTKAIAGPLSDLDLKSKATT